MKDLRSRIAAATDTRDPEEYVERVKNVMRREIETLDPQAEIVDTRYFNHSAIPDFLVSWDKSSNKRSIYIRDEMANVAAAHDAHFLPDRSPAVITLDLDSADSEVHGRIANQVSEKPDTLITSVNALSSLEDSPKESSPVTKVVRSQFIRGARGLLDEIALNSLLGPTALSTSEASDDENIRAHFVPESAALISRTTQLLALARNEENLPEAPANPFEGRLSMQELANILPWILRTSENQPSESFFAKLGQMFNFADLENLHEDLQGLDLSRLIEPNLSRWTAKRAYAGLFVSKDGNMEAGKSVDNRSEWNFRGKTIGLDLPQQGARITVVHHGSKLRGGSSASTATWENIEPLLKTYKPLRVNLQGLRRSVVVNAVESDDIRQDIADITETVEDRYYVQEVAVSARGAEDDEVILDVHLGQRLATCPDDCLLEDITRITTDLLVTPSPGGNE